MREVEKHVDLYFLCFGSVDGSVEVVIQCRSGCITASYEYVAMAIIIQKPIARSHELMISDNIISTPSRNCIASTLQRELKVHIGRRSDPRQDRVSTAEAWLWCKGIGNLVPERFAEAMILAELSVRSCMRSIIHQQSEAYDRELYSFACFDLPVDFTINEERIPESHPTSIVSGSADLGSNNSWHRSCDQMD